MAISNIDFRLTVNGVYAFPWSSVFWYRKTSAHVSTDAESLYEAFRINTLPLILGVMNSVADVQNIEVVNLVDVTDYTVGTPVAHLGAITSTSPAPTFVAYGLRLNRSSRAGRHGYKRFVGVCEELVSFGSTTVSGALVAAMAALTAGLDNIITSGGASFQPMIPHRQLVTLPDDTEQYVLDDLLPISSVEFYGLTTQNTRKS